MMFSKLGVDVSNPSARQSLRAARDMHRTLLSAFGQAGESARKEMGVLYRVMEGGAGISVYVLSEAQPDWTALRGKGFFVEGVPKNIDALTRAFQPGRGFAFDLLACPEKKNAREGRIGNRVPLQSPEERAGWLARRAQSGGFAVEGSREEGEVRLQIAHSEGKGGDVQLRAIRFVGVLRVTDPERFACAYREGIGPGKAYGCGMLLLRAAGG